MTRVRVTLNLTPTLTQLLRSYVHFQTYVFDLWYCYEYFMQFV